MALFALLTLNIQGNSSSVSHPWFLDFAASNLIIGSSKNFHNVYSCNGTKKIQNIDGYALSITNIGDLNPDFWNMPVSPRLASNVLFIGQLVDN